MRWLLTFLWVMAPAPALAANALIADLSKDHITIQSDFTGETLLLFGAIEPDQLGQKTDIVVVLRGPGEDFMLRRKQKRFGIWVNTDSYRLGPLPGFLAVNSTRPLDQIAPPQELQKHYLRPAHMSANVQEETGVSLARSELVDGFVRLRQAAKLYDENPEGVTVIDERLFRAEINLPSGMPVGTYVTEFLAFRNGRLVGYQTGELPVDIVGAGHILHQAAYDMPLVYGLAGVALAVLMGWGVAVIFRRT